MNRNTIIAALAIIAFFTVFLAFKEFIALRNQVYWSAYYGSEESLL